MRKAFAILAVLAGGVAQAGNCGYSGNYHNNNNYYPTVAIPVAAVIVNPFVPTVQAVAVPTVVPVTPVAPAAPAQPMPRANASDDSSQAPTYGFPTTVVANETGYGFSAGYGFRHDEQVVKAAKRKGKKKKR